MADWFDGTDGRQELVKEDRRQALEVRRDVQRQPGDAVTPEKPIVAASCHVPTSACPPTPAVGNPLPPLLFYQPTS